MNQHNVDRRSIQRKGDEWEKNHLSALLSVSSHFSQTRTFISFQFNSLVSESSKRFYDN